MSIDTALPKTDSTLPAQDSGVVSIEYQPAIDALDRIQGSDKSEIDYLVDRATESGATRQQLPGVLDQACARLARVRSEASRDVLSDLLKSEDNAAVARAYDALQAARVSSLESAEHLFEIVFEQLSLMLNATPDLLASITATQAELAAIAQDHRRAADLFAQAAATQGLSEATQWRYQYERAIILEELGRGYGDTTALDEAVRLYENVVLALAPRAQRPDDWSATQHSLGNVLGILGQRGRGIRHLERSIAAFERALCERSREHNALEWAATQHGLGNALGILAQRQGDADMLERAVSLLGDALEVRSRQKTPAEWAQSQYHLGTALLTLGQVKRDASVLARSINAFRQVLLEWTQERAPLDWAKGQNSLGTALRVRGEQEKEADSADLKEAVEAYQRALDVWTREQWPEEWAMTQNNLGAALQRLGEQGNNVSYLGAAATAYENALKAWGRDERPIVWAMTRANLGDVRQSLAEHMRDVEMARKAVADFEAVAEVFHDASHARYYELAKEQLAAARELAAALVV